jgi:hypothetical protein
MQMKEDQENNNLQKTSPIIWKIQKEGPKIETWHALFKRDGIGLQRSSWPTKIITKLLTFIVWGVSSLKWFIAQFNIVKSLHSTPLRGTCSRANPATQYLLCRLIRPQKVNKKQQWCLSKAAVNHRCPWKRLMSRIKIKCLRSARKTEFKIKRQSWVFWQM